MQHAHDGQPPVDASATSLAIFDLDGTLTNPVPGLLSCHRYALGEVGLDFDALTQHAGVDVSDLVRSPVAEVYERLGVPDAASTDAQRHYRERRPLAGLEDALYPGVDVLLTSLANAGWRISVATNQLEVMAERMVSRLGLAEHVVAVAGSDRERTRTTKAQIIAHLVASVDPAPKGIAVIADRGTDVDAARSIGATAIGAAWGFGSIEELIAANADAIAVTPADVTDLLLGDA